ncbi:UV DNA damage repair endonuclease UvsE [Bacillus tianshenii]|nr:UV DNA damage repair endonuclease UvsE [Bacillus tianshenii]
MIVRFGYVAHALSLWEASPSRTLTFTNWKKLNKQERADKLYSIAKTNLVNTKRALHYNISQGIPLYRFSSALIPLATHPEVVFDYLTMLREDFQEIGELVQKHNLRVSFHPNQFTLFTSEDNNITNNSVEDMLYHYEMLQAMGVEENALINIHVGGAYGDKEQAIGRFHKNIKKLPPEVKAVMTLENDDRTYNAEEVLNICEEAAIPMIFDYHHEQANPSSISYEKLLPRIFDTWANRGLLPKVHLSSPESEKNYRKHSELVATDFITPFMKVARQISKDFDVMIEAKGKDKAALQLMDWFEKQRGVKRINGAVIQFPTKR